LGVVVVVLEVLVDGQPHSVVVVVLLVVVVDEVGPPPDVVVVLVVEVLVLLVDGAQPSLSSTHSEPAADQMNLHCPAHAEAAAAVVVVVLVVDVPLIVPVSAS